MTAKPAFADRHGPAALLRDRGPERPDRYRGRGDVGRGTPGCSEVAGAFVRHMHAFAREVRLTEDELHLGIDFLNRIGQASHDAHNEGVLFSDAIGLSTLVCLLNNGQGGATETAAALLGPFWRMNSPRTENGGSIVRSPTPGAALFASCRVTDPKGTPIAGVEIDVWQASPVGLYENQDDAQADMNLRGKFVTDADGRFCVPLGEAGRLSGADPWAGRRDAPRPTTA